MPDPDGAGAVTSKPRYRHRVNRRRALTIVAAIVAVAAVAVVIAVVAGARVAERQRVFIATARGATSTGFAGIPDEQLLASLDATCKEIANGVTLDDKLDAAPRNYEATKSLSNVTLEQFKENIRANRVAAEAAGC